MTTTNGWPGKPGTPINREKDGWHWVHTPDGEIVPYNWRPEGECERGRWAYGWVYDQANHWPPIECTYLGPVLTPDEATALQKRVAELEGALKDAAASVKEWGAYASQYLQDKWDLPGEVARYIATAEGKNDAALEGKKDE